MLLVLVTSDTEKVAPVRPHIHYVYWNTNSGAGSHNSSGAHTDCRWLTPFSPLLGNHPLLPFIIYPASWWASHPWNIRPPQREGPSSMPVTCSCVNTSETHCRSLAPSTTNITAPPADAHRRSVGTHRSLPQQSIAIGSNTASRRTHTHYFSKNHLIFSHLSPGFPRGPFPSRRPTNTQDISSLPFVLHTLTSFSVITTFADAHKKQLFMHFSPGYRVSLSLSLSLWSKQPPLLSHLNLCFAIRHTIQADTQTISPCLLDTFCPLQPHSNPMQTAAGVATVGSKQAHLLGQTVGSCWETIFQSDLF